MSKFVKTRIIQHGFIRIQRTIRFRTFMWIDNFISSILRIMFINDSSINLNIRVEIYSQENEEKKIKC